MPTHIQNQVKPVDSQIFQQAVQAETSALVSNSGLPFSTDNMDYLATHSNPGVAAFARSLATPEVLQRPSVVRHMAKAKLADATDFQKYAFDHPSEDIRLLAARWILSTVE